MEVKRYKAKIEWEYENGVDYPFDLETVVKSSDYYALAEKFRVMRDALKYVRRFVKKENVDTDYLDEVIDKE